MSENEKEKSKARTHYGSKWMYMSEKMKGRLHRMNKKLVRLN